MFLSQFLSFAFFSRKNLADPSQLKFGKICPITTTLKYPPQTMNAQKSSLKPFTSKLFASNSTGLLKVFWRPHFSLFLLSLLFLLFPIFVIFLSILSFHLSFSPTRICMISTHNRMFLLHLFRTLPMTYQKLHLTTPKAGSVTQHCHARLELLPNRMREHSIRTISR